MQLQMKEMREYGLCDEASEILEKRRRKDGDVCEAVIRTVEATVRFLAAKGIEGIKFNLRYIHDSIQDDHSVGGYTFKPEDGRHLLETFREWMSGNNFDTEDGNWLDGSDVTLRWGDDNEILDATSNGAADAIFFPNYVFMRNGWTTVLEG